MEPDFWRARWAEGKTAFHEGHPNSFLIEHAARFEDAQRRVLVPLCGKTVDLAFLAQRGHEVIGVELVEDAAKQFFAGAAPEVVQDGAHVRYRAAGVTIFVGDFFATTPAQLGPLNALYDRAAMIALPPELRGRYVDHVRALVAAGSPGLLVTLEYPDGAMAGPPFSVGDREVRERYAGATVELLGEIPTQSARMKAEGVEAVERCYALAL